MTEENKAEEWREVPGSDGKYLISNLGRVMGSPVAKRNGERVIRKLQINQSGYPVVSLILDHKYHTKSVHRLVAAAFIGPCPDGMEVNHIDSNRANPRVENLEYVTRSQNHIHAFRFGFRKPNFLHGEQIGSSRLTKAQAIEALTSPVSAVELAQKFGVGSSAIDRIRYGITWKFVRKELGLPLEGPINCQIGGHVKGVPAWNKGRGGRRG